MADIYFTIFTSDEWKFNWLTRENAKRYFNDLYNSPKFIGYCFYKDEKLLGACFGNVSDYFNTVQYYIKEIFININMQKHGLGTEFLMEIERDLKSQGVNHMTLLTSKTIPAYSFYHNNGYLDSHDSVYMVKPL